MTLYTRKAIPIKAYSVDLKDRENVKYFDNEYTVFNDVAGDYILIKTLEGDVKCRDQNYLVKGIHGELYPCNPTIFYKIYERAREQCLEQ